MDSKPLEDITQGQNLRFIGRICKNKQYGKYINSGKGLRKYRGKDEIAVRNFLKALLSTPPLFNLSRDGFYSIESIIEFIHCFNPSIKLTKSGLGVLQQRVKSYK